jgi:hypothetical protein
VATERFGKLNANIRKTLAKSSLRFGQIAANVDTRR